MKIIAVDFDGTIVDHMYPRIGNEVPGAVRWLKEFVSAGARLILWTTRDGVHLYDAAMWLDERGVELWGANKNREQHDWTGSPKAYAHIYIDDAAFGCPLRENPRVGGRPFVDWDKVGPAVMEILTRDEKAA